MAARMTALSYMIKTGDNVSALQYVTRYPTVLSNSKEIGTALKSKLLGTSLHISKAKKVTFSKTLGNKLQRKESSYYRLLFCRLDIVYLTVIRD